MLTPKLSFYAECYLCWLLQIIPLCWMSLCCVSMCWVSLCWVSICWMSLCWASICWVSWRRLSSFGTLKFGSSNQHPTLSASPLASTNPTYRTTAQFYILHFHTTFPKIKNIFKNRNKMFKTVFFVAFVAAVATADFCDKTRPGDNVIKLFTTVIYKWAK